MNENTNTKYLRFIRKKASKGDAVVRLQLYPNQVKNLRNNLGFKVTCGKMPKRRMRVHEMKWYNVDCRNAAKGTEAWKTYGLVLAHERKVS